MGSLYLVNQIFEWIKLHCRHLHQIQENLASRTALYVNSLLIMQAGMQK